MTNKEKEAIERCNQLIKVEHANWIGISNQVAIETVLNLIQNQQEEIFKLQAKVDRLKVARDNWKKTFYQAEEEIEKYKYLYQKALDNTIKADRDNLKKDKIIDLTIAFISTRYKEDEDINNFAKEVMERGEWTNLNKILKEYFTNKVEKENKDE